MPEPPNAGVGARAPASSSYPRSAAPAAAPARPPAVASSRSVVGGPNQNASQALHPRPATKVVTVTPVAPRSAARSAVRSAAAKPVSSADFVGIDEISAESSLGVDNSSSRPDPTCDGVVCCLGCLSLFPGVRKKIVDKVAFFPPNPPGYYIREGSTGSGAFLQGMGLQQKVC